MSSSARNTVPRGHPDPGALLVRPSRIHGLGLFAARALPGRRKLGEISGRLVRLPRAREEVELRPVICHVELDERVALDCLPTGGSGD